MLAQPGCQWLATMDDGRFFDGATGRVFTWDGEDFVSTDQLADDFLLTPPAPRGMVHVRAVHPASLTARIGELTERVFRDWRAASPAGWRVHGPASEPSDIAALSAHCLSVAAASVVAWWWSAHRAAGRRRAASAALSVDRLAAASPGARGATTEAVDPLDPSALDSFGAAVRRTHARTALLGHALGYSRSHVPRASRDLVPGCAVFGPPRSPLSVRRRSPGRGRTQARLSRSRSGAVGCAYPLRTGSTSPGSPHPLEEYLQLAQRLHDGD